ncbi:MAG: hypothetical protein WCK34_02855 [Bacteroidota bacterium]
MKNRITFSQLSIFINIFIVTVVSSNLNWGKNRWQDVIVSDGKGYYAYLPAVFIYHDLNFGFFNKIEKEDYYNKNLYYEYRTSAFGKVLDKYFCGTALVEMPFFLAAHSLSRLCGYKADGYSQLYHIFINIAAIFYLFIGLIFLNLTLKHYQIKEWEKSLVLFAAVFGTNLFYYTIREPGMSHVYSFAFIAMFFHYSVKYFSTLKQHYIPILGLILGIIFLIRPVNGLIIFIFPFASGSFESFRRGVITALRKPLALVSGLLLFAGIASAQLVIYKISTGHFIIDSYVDERFNFLNPHLADILFSYKKGLFLYTPMFLISMTGGYDLWRTSKFSFFAWFGFFFLITYVFSSWWCWFYGGSFSSRVYVEFIPLFMILLAIALNSFEKRALKTGFIVIILALIVICQIQTYQYRYFIIHWSNMTMEKYWEVFLRVDKLIK